MVIKAVGKRLIVKEIKEEKEDKKGLIIPVSGPDKLKAVVFALGNEVDTQVSIEDIVIMQARVGNSVEIDGEIYLTIFEDQILAVIGK